MRQYITFDGTTVFDTSSSDNYFKDITLKRAAGMIPSLVFTVEPGGTLPSQLSTLITANAIDGSGNITELFRGYAYAIEKNLAGECTVTCEGMASLLNSVVISELKMRKTYKVRDYTASGQKTWTIYSEETVQDENQKTTVICYAKVADQLADLQKIINAQASVSFTLALNGFSTSKKRVKLDFERGTALELIQAIAEAMNANLYFYGTTVAFCKSTWNIGSAMQTIQYGENLMELTQNWDYSPVATGIIPYGEKFIDTSYYLAGETAADWHRLDLEYIDRSTYTDVKRVKVPLSDGTNAYRYAIVDSAKEAAYGRHYVTKTWEDEDSYSDLYDEAKDYLDSLQGNRTIEVNALDLSGTGDYAPYKTVTVVGIPDGNTRLSATLRITESEMHFGEPEKDIVSIGSEGARVTNSIGTMSAQLEGAILDSVRTNIIECLTADSLPNVDIDVPDKVVEGYYNPSDNQMYESFSDGVYSDAITGETDVAYIGNEMAYKPAGLDAYDLIVAGSEFDIYINYSIASTSSCIVNTSEGYVTVKAGSYTGTLHIHAECSSVVSNGALVVALTPEMWGGRDVYFRVYGVNGATGEYGEGCSLALTVNGTFTDGSSTEYEFKELAYDVDYVYGTYTQPVLNSSQHGFYLDRTLVRSTTYRYVWDVFTFEIETVSGVGEHAVQYTADTSTDGLYEFDTSAGYILSSRDYYIYDDGIFKKKSITGDSYYTKAQVNTLLEEKADKDDVPTKTSDITNDSNFVSDASYVHTDNNFTSTLKSKLDGIASGAEVNVQSDWSVTDTTSDAYIKNKPTIPTSMAWSAITGKPTTISGYGITDAKIANGTITLGSNTITPLTSHQDLSAYAKTADLATVATSGSYNDLSNKPTIPTVNNATLTIQKNGSNVATFTANASSNVTANVTVPTKLSEFTDDVVSGNYLPLAGGTLTGVTVRDNGAGERLILQQWGWVYEQYNATTKAVSFDLEFNGWYKRFSRSDTGAEIYLPSSSGTFALTSDIPTKVSALTNDSGYITGITKAMVTDALGYTPPASDTTYTAGTNISISSSNVISATNTTYSVATNTTAGLIKPWYSHTAASTGPTAGSNSTAVAVNAITTTSGRYYGVEMDSNGRAFVNVPWSNTNTTYSAGTGLSLSSTTFNHSNSVTAGTAGTSSATSGANTLAVPYVTYDAQGHVTAAGTHTHTITAGSVASGNNYFVKGGTVYTALASYLPLAGGTMNGDASITCVQASASNVSGFKIQSTYNGTTRKWGLEFGTGRVNRGLFDYPSGRWAFYADENNYGHLGLVDNYCCNFYPASTNTYNLGSTAGVWNYIRGKYITAYIGSQANTSVNDALTNNFIIRQVYGNISISSKTLTISISTSGTDASGVVFSVPFGHAVRVTYNATGGHKYIQLGTCTKTATLPTIQTAGTGRIGYAGYTSGSGTYTIKPGAATTGGTFNTMGMYDCFVGFGKSTSAANTGTCTIEVYPY